MKKIIYGIICFGFFCAVGLGIGLFFVFKDKNSNLATLKLFPAPKKYPCFPYERKFDMKYFNKTYLNYETSNKNPDRFKQKFLRSTIQEFNTEKLQFAFENDYIEIWIPKNSKMKKLYLIMNAITHLVYKSVICLDEPRFMHKLRIYCTLNIFFRFLINNYITNYDMPDLKQKSIIFLLAEKFNKDVKLCVQLFEDINYNLNKYKMIVVRSSILKRAYKSELIEHQNFFQLHNSIEKNRHENMREHKGKLIKSLKCCKNKRNTTESLNQTSNNEKNENYNNILLNFLKTNNSAFIEANMLEIKNEIVKLGSKIQDKKNIDNLNKNNIDLDYQADSPIKKTKTTSLEDDENYKLSEYQIALNELLSNDFSCTLSL